MVELFRTSFENDFATEGIGTWGTVERSTEWAFRGSYSCKHTGSAGNGAWIETEISQPTVNVRTYVLTPMAYDASNVLFRLGNVATLELNYVASTYAVLRLTELYTNIETVLSIPWDLTTPKCIEIRFAKDAINGGCVVYVNDIAVITRLGQNTSAVVDVAYARSGINTNNSTAITLYQDMFVISTDHIGLEGGGTPTYTLNLTATPLNVEVSVNGSVLGYTPQSPLLPAGDYVISVPSEVTA